MSKHDGLRWSDSILARRQNGEVCGYCNAALRAGNAQRHLCRCAEQLVANAAPAVAVDRRITLTIYAGAADTRIGLPHRQFAQVGEEAQR